MLSTPLLRQLGVELPIFSAGMGGNMAGPELTAAVSNAGGFGVIGLGGLPAPFMREQIKKLRTLTRKPFGVNIIMPMMQEGQIEVCMDERVPVMILFWGDPKPYIADAHRRGIKVFLQVGDVDEAANAAAAGIDGIIAQGIEAGGHVKSTTTLATIVPVVVDVVGKLPVVAAGGIADGRGLVAALSLGAQAVSMGTRFVCAEETGVTQAYKERIVASRAEDTAYTTLFNIGWPNAAHRVLRNRVYREWEAAGCPAAGERPGEGKIIGHMPVAGATIDVVKYMVMPSMTGFDGDIEESVLYCGVSCNLINDIKPAAQIVHEVMAEARLVVEQLAHA